MAGFSGDSSQKVLVASIHVGVMVMELRDMITMKRGIQINGPDVLTVFESIRWTMSMVDYCLGDDARVLRGLQSSIDKHHLTSDNVDELAATTRVLLTGTLARARKVFQEQGFVAPSHLVTSIDPLTVGITWKDRS